MQDVARTDALEPISRGVAQSGVRIANERAVLTLIALNPGSSNADLSRLSGLGPQTTSRIVADLEARGLVNRGQVLRGRRGQPATPLYLNPHGAFSIGVEIGWQHFEVLLFDVSGKVLASVRRSYAWPSATTVFVDVAADVATILSGLTPLQRGRLAGIGIASPTNLERYIEQLGAPSEQVELWRGLDVAAQISHHTGLTAEWINDGNAACWSELIARPVPRPADFTYLQVGTFLGGGIVSNGELWNGPRGDTANLGGIMVSDADGRPCFLYTIASLQGLQSRLAQAGQSLPAGSPLNWDWPALEPVAGQWLDDAGLALAKALVSMRAIIDFDTAVIDGVLPRAVATRLVRHVRHHTSALPSLSVERPFIDMGTIGASAAAVGAAQRVLFSRFFSRAWNLFAT